MKTKNFIILSGLIFICLCVCLICIFSFRNEKTVFDDSTTQVDVENKLNDEWIITQHGRNDINLSFYTIYNENEGLIVVDGGWSDDASNVREVVDELGGHINAWILTHPHQDHIGAFNLLYNELEGITIDKIYTVKMASAEECIEIAPWDSVDAYNDFLSLNIEDITYVYPGDNFEICGLNFEILSAYDENVKKLSRDYLNDGSMIFKVTNYNESMLFCADVGINMSDFLVNKYGTDLKADYLQMAHHGYGGLSDEFYQLVSPNVAFFDAPDWLMYDETGKYDNPQNADFMRLLNAEIYSFNTAPNSIVLK